jgi:hypothetical protein
MPFPTITIFTFLTNAQYNSIEIISLESRIVHGGRSMLVAFVRVHSRDTAVLQGFLTFLHVDYHGRPLPHGLTISSVNEEDRVLQEDSAALSA